MEKLELEIIALSHSITQSHSYAVVLGEMAGSRRLPIVIGGFEAQAIAVAIEKMAPSRPLTHDLTKNLCETFNINLKEIIINNLVDGIFYAKLVCDDGKDVIEVDSRTSDALALAVRFDCPIYTYEFILDSAGITMEGEEEGKEEPAEEAPRGKGTTKGRKKKAATEEVPKEEGDLSKYSLHQLNAMLKDSLEKENYERAIRYRDEINRRRKDS